MIRRETTTRPRGGATLPMVADPDAGLDLAARFAGAVATRPPRAAPAAPRVRADFERARHATR